MSSSRMINYSDSYINMLMSEYAAASVGGASGYDAFRVMLTKHEQETAVVWDTTCAGCRRLLNKLKEIDDDEGRRNE